MGNGCFSCCPFELLGIISCFPFAQLLVAFVTQLSELFGFGHNA